MDVDRRVQEGSPQGRFDTGRFATKLEGSPQRFGRFAANVIGRFATTFECIIKHRFISLKTTKTLNINTLYHHAMIITSINILYFLTVDYTHRLLIILNIRYSKRFAHYKRHTVTDNNVFLSVSRKL